MPVLTELVERIDAAIEKTQSAEWGADETKPRRHLGASTIGRDCLREVAYGWRWGAKKHFRGQLLRLFNRGHEEEPRFARWFEFIGATVQVVDPKSIYDLWWHPESESYHIEIKDTAEEQTYAQCLEVSHDPRHVAMAAAAGVSLPDPRQQSFTGYRGHYKGSIDSLLWNVPGLEKYGLSLRSKLLGEFKTHNDKSFKDLVSKGVRISKPDHFAQAQTYSDAEGCDAIIYGGVNKNTDELHLELLFNHPETVAWAEQRAKALIDNNRIPPRPKYASPYAHQCKMCDFRRICVLHEPAWKTCRMCTHSQPVDDGRWQCNKWGVLIPKEKEIDGCPSYAQMDND